jgi:hypothetical protein
VHVKPFSSQPKKQGIQWTSTKRLWSVFLKKWDKHQMAVIGVFQESIERLWSVFLEKRDKHEKAVIGILGEARQALNGGDRCFLKKRTWLDQAVGTLQLE